MTFLHRFHRVGSNERSDSLKRKTLLSTSTMKGEQKSVQIPIFLHYPKYCNDGAWGDPAKKTSLFLEKSKAEKKDGECSRKRLCTFFRVWEEVFQVGNVTLSVFTAPKRCEINATNSDDVYLGFITI